jgi:hypothetical protein
MRTRRRGLGVWITAAALAAAPGCGSSETPSAGPKTLQKVSGKITIKGKPATKGKVTLSNVATGGQWLADVGAGGAYEVTAPVGVYSVVVAGTGDPAAESAYNTASLEVKPGPNTLDLDLPLQQGK